MRLFRSFADPVYDRMEVRCTRLFINKVQYGVISDVADLFERKGTVTPHRVEGPMADVQQSHDSLRHSQNIP